jgi:hypothetical protein
MLLPSLLLLLSAYQYGGTFIGAVICSDGIVVASDSRTTFMDGKGRPFAYVDGMPKIYADRGAAVAFSGMTSLDGELLSSFVSRNPYLLAPPVDDILFGFLLHMPFANANGVVMISAGFLDAAPMICVKPPIDPQTCSHSGYITNKASPVLNDTLAKLRGRPTVMEARAALKAAIEESSKTDSTVGGPISILTLTQDGPPQWSGAVPSDGGLSQICDLIRRRRADIVPLGSQQDLDSHLSAACPK